MTTSFTLTQKRLMRKAQQPPRASESAEQRAVIEWARLQAGAYPELALLFHIPNGGKRPSRTGAMLRLQGVVAGVPDLFMACARRGHHGLWIEMKAERGRVSEAQGAMIVRLRHEGYHVVVCYNAGEAITAIATYLGIRL